MQWLFWIVAGSVVIVVLLAVGRRRRRHQAVRLLADFLSRCRPSYRVLRMHGHTLVLGDAEGSEIDLNSLQLANALTRTDGSQRQIDAVFAQLLDAIERAEADGSTDPQAVRVQPPADPDRK